MENGGTRLKGAAERFGGPMIGVIRPGAGL